MNKLKLNFYLKEKKYTEYEKTALEYYKNSENFESEELLKAAWIFSENITTPSSLKKAEEWAEKSVMKAETAENTYILAKLYAKSGKKDNAKMYAEMSKNIAESQGSDTTLTKQLLETLK